MACRAWAQDRQADRVRTWGQGHLLGVDEAGVQRGQQRACRLALARSPVHRPHHQLRMRSVQDKTLHASQPRHVMQSSKCRRMHGDLNCRCAAPCRVQYMQRPHFRSPAARLGRIELGMRVMDLAARAGLVHKAVPLHHCAAHAGGFVMQDTVGASSG